jgi:putative endonuclease
MRKSRLDYEFYVYIMSSLTGTLYIGVTNNIVRRVWEHKNNKVAGFTQKYECHILVYYQSFQYINDAINREKQLKKWNGRKKENLIKVNNPHWKDLSEGWYE